MAGELWPVLTWIGGAWLGTAWQARPGMTSRGEVDRGVLSQVAAKHGRQGMASNLNLQVSNKGINVKSIALDIAQKYIDAGHRRDCNQCPIALAIYDRLAEGWDVEVSQCRIGFYSPDGGSFWVDSNLEIQRFVVAFDEGGRGKVSPRLIELDVTDVPEDAFAEAA